MIVSRCGGRFCEDCAFQNVNFGGDNAAAVYLFDAEGCIDVQRGYGFVKNVRGEASVEESAEEHITADTGEAIQISNLHYAPSPLAVGFAPLNPISETGSSAFIEPDR